MATATQISGRYRPLLVNTEKRLRHEATAVTKWRSRLGARAEIATTYRSALALTTPTGFLTASLAMAAVESMLITTFE